MNTGGKVKMYKENKIVQATDLRKYYLSRANLITGSLTTFPNVVKVLENGKKPFNLRIQLSLDGPQKINDLGSLVENKFFIDCQNSTYTSILINTDICSEHPANDFLKSVDNYFSFFTRVILQKGKEIIIKNF